MNLKINKNAILAITMLSAGFAFSEYVSVLGSNAEIKVVSSDNFTEDDQNKMKDEIKDEMMPVGSVVLRLDSINPSSLYGGTWDLVTGDASLSLGNGSDLTAATVSGNNEQIVKLPKHSHSIDHDHPNHSTTAEGRHRHGIKSESAEGYTDGAIGDTSDDNDPAVSTTTLYTEYANDHTHSVNLPLLKATSGTAGTETNPLMDVRGARLPVNVWTRIN